MEPLDPTWPARRDGMDQILYGSGKEGYGANRRAFLAANGTRMELLREQIMVYFVFGYFCGAVYNESPYGKMKLAVAATILTEEMLMAEWLKEKQGSIGAESRSGIRAAAAVRCCRKRRSWIWCIASPERWSIPMKTETFWRMSW